MNARAELTSSQLERGFQAHCRAEEAADARETLIDADAVSIAQAYRARIAAGTPCHDLCDRFTEMPRETVLELLRLSDADDLDGIGQFLKTFRAARDQAIREQAYYDAEVAFEKSVEAALSEAVADRFQQVSQRA